MDGLFYRVNENHELCAWFPKSGSVAEIFYPNVAKNKILIRKKEPLTFGNYMSLF